MNPYERTAQEMRRQSEGPKRFAKKALGIGSAVGATAFAPILSRAAPFLSEYIPEELAIKGLSKIHPKLGEFVKSAMGEGSDFQEVKSFLGEQINESTHGNSIENRNIVQQYSPELHEFMTKEIESGRSPLEAGALASLGGKGKDFKSIISKITKDHKSPWSSIVESVYGSQGVQKQQSSMEQEQQGVPGQQTQQIGPGNQALMAILQEANQILKRSLGS